MIQHLDSLNRPAIVVGDFNCEPSSPAMNYFIEHRFQLIDKGQDKLSFQGTDPVEIDHVVYRNTDEVRFEVRSSELLSVPVLSDHRPFIVVLEAQYNMR